jgi:predicted RNase H-like nuclease
VTAVLGADWHKGGWVAVVLAPGAEPEVIAGTDLEALVARVPGAACVAVDMPIGLPDTTREADRLARAFVGVRRNSVFMTPPRDALAVETYAEANVIAAGLLSGRKISQQAWALRANITVVERLAERDPRVIEVHPEVSFRQMTGAEVPFAKTTWNGQSIRRAALAAAGIVLPDRLAEGGTIPAADVLDAGAAAWSAQRHARGEARSLPSGVPPGARGVIWY